jgi:hypothetical protein
MSKPRLFWKIETMKVLKQFVWIVLTGSSFLSAQAQGTVGFANIHNGGPNAPVFESDGVTKLSGPQFMAELLGGASSANLVSLATTAFLTGAGAGYFIAREQEVPGVVPGTEAWVQVHVWNTASGGSFPQAQASGLPNSWWASPVFSVTSGGGAVNPTPPGALTGLGNEPVYLNSVPEPSVLTMVVLGAALILSRAFRSSPTRRWSQARPN